MLDTQADAAQALREFARQPLERMMEDERTRRVFTIAIHRTEYSEEMRAALERHLEASSTRHGDDDPSVVAAYEDLADAFEAYDDALNEAYGEMTPLIVVDDDSLDSGDEEYDDDEDEDGYSGLDDEDYDVEGEDGDSPQGGR